MGFPQKREQKRRTLRDKDRGQIPERLTGKIEDLIEGPWEKPALEGQGFRLNRHPAGGLRGFPSRIGGHREAPGSEPHGLGGSAGRRMWSYRPDPGCVLTGQGSVLKMRKRWSRGRCGRD